MPHSAELLAPRAHRAPLCMQRVLPLSSLLRLALSTGLVLRIGAAASSSAASRAASAIPARMEGAPVTAAGRDVLIVAGGCFWCIEAVMNNVRGVDTAISGYLNGHTANPTYKEVCGGDSGHVEAVRVTFDPAVVSMQKLLRMWVTVHDPTQLNRQVRVQRPRACALGAGSAGGIAKPQTSGPHARRRRGRGQVR